MYGLAQFAVRDEDREKKLEFLFRIYDMDRDGYISNGELFQVTRFPTQKSYFFTISQKKVCGFFCRPGFTDIYDLFPFGEGGGDFVIDVTAKREKGLCYVRSFRFFPPPLPSG